MTKLMKRTTTTVEEFIDELPDIDDFDGAAAAADEADETASEPDALPENRPPLRPARR